MLKNAPILKPIKVITQNANNATIENSVRSIALSAPTITQNVNSTITAPISSNSSRDDFQTKSIDAATDWIISDFNLLSCDFNNDLKFISGNLFDLNFNYKLFRTLNYTCLLLEARNLLSSSQLSQENKYFLLKVNYWLHFLDLNE